MDADLYTITMTRVEEGSDERDVREISGRYYLFETSVNFLVTPRQRFRVLQEAERGLEGHMVNGVPPYCVTATYRISDIPGEILIDSPDVYATTDEDMRRAEENILPEDRGL